MLILESCLLLCLDAQLVTRIKFNIRHFKKAKRKILVFPIYRSDIWKLRLNLCDGDHQRPTTSYPRSIFKTLKPELCPKWLALAELLRTCEPQGAVVVLVEEERIRKQLEEVI